MFNDNFSLVTVLIDAFHSDGVNVDSAVYTHVNIYSVTSTGSCMVVITFQLIAHMHPCP